MTPLDLYCKFTASVMAKKFENRIVLDKVTGSIVASFSRHGIKHTRRKLHSCLDVFSE